jgi:hypothetical protein
LFAIPVATFGGVDRWSEDLMEVVAGAHVYPADPIGVQWIQIRRFGRPWKHIDVVLLKTSLFYKFNDSA